MTPDFRAHGEFSSELCLGCDIKYVIFHCFTCNLTLSEGHDSQNETLNDGDGSDMRTRYLNLNILSNGLPWYSGHVVG